MLKTTFLRMIDKVRWISHFIIKWSLSCTSSWHIIFTWDTHIFIWRRALTVTLSVQSDHPYIIVLVDVLIRYQWYPVDTLGRTLKIGQGWTKAVIRAAGTFVSVYFPYILRFAITSSIFWCKSIYWLRDTSRTAYFCSKCDQGFMDERSCSVVPESVVSWSIFEQSLMQSPHRSSYGQKHGQELSSVQHGQSNDLVSCGHWQPSQN